MLQIVYISTARQPVLEADLRSILKVSRINNLGSSVTGLLVSGGRRFLQALEGPEAAVLATFERIKADERHFGIVALGFKAVEARQFGTWSMAFEAGGDADSQDLNAAVAALVAPLQDKNMQAQFTGFAELNAKAA